MFLIVPKPRAPISRTKNGSTDDSKGPQRLPALSVTALRGPARVQNACDECRLRKTKCNGEQPCGRCRSREAVCVYDHALSKSRAREPMSPAEASMLQAQQARLIVALKNMSALIAELKSGIASEDSEDNSSGTAAHQEANQDLIDILEQYAPSHTISLEVAQMHLESSPESSCTDAGESRNRKRQRGDLHSDLHESTGSLPSAQCRQENFPPQSVSDQSSPEVPLSRNNILKIHTETQGMATATMGASPQLANNDFTSGPRLEDPYASFMGMLQTTSSTTAMSSQPHNTIYDNYTSRSTNRHWNTSAPEPRFNANFDIQVPHHVLNNVQIAPLLDMVDWNASWRTCSDMFSGNEFPLLPQQQLSQPYDISWGP